MIATTLIFVITLLVWFKGSWLTRSTAINKGDYVVLLHGLGRSSWSMHLLGRSLAKEGYRVINLDYPSTTNSIEYLTDNTLKPKIEKYYTDKTRKISFVTHSMGGILVRQYLNKYDLENLNRVVMIAPPNKGSELADKWASDRLKGYFLGLAVYEMTTKLDSFVNQLPLPNYKFAVIAGINDEKVSVERTKLSNMEDYLLVNNEHTFIMMDKNVMKATIRYLTNGKF